MITLFISHEVWPFGRGTTRSLGDARTMVLNRITGMILQVATLVVEESCGNNFFAEAKNVGIYKTFFGSLNYRHPTINIWC